MPREPRIDFPGAWHHVMHRGARRVTGASLAELRRAEMGPRANPARRFAAFALARRTDLTRAEIGRLLAMSMRQVHNVVNRWSEADPRLTLWREALDGEGPSDK
jgi:hypothetical protein